MAEERATHLASLATAIDVDADVSEYVDVDDDEVPALGKEPTIVVVVEIVLNLSVYELESQVV